MNYNKISLYFLSFLLGFVIINLLEFNIQKEMQENVVAKLDVYKQCQHKLLLRKNIYESVMINPSYLMFFDQEN